MATRPPNTKAAGRGIDGVKHTILSNGLDQWTSPNNQPNSTWGDPSHPERPLSMYQNEPLYRRAAVSSGVRVRTPLNGSVTRVAFGNGQVYWYDKNGREMSDSEVNQYQSRYGDSNDYTPPPRKQQKAPSVSKPVPANPVSSKQTLQANIHTPFAVHMGYIKPTHQTNQIKTPEPTYNHPDYPSMSSPSYRSGPTQGMSAPHPVGSVLGRINAGLYNNIIEPVTNAITGTAESAYNAWHAPIDAAREQDLANQYKFQADANRNLIRPGQKTNVKAADRYHSMSKQHAKSASEIRYKGNEDATSFIPFGRPVYHAVTNRFDPVNDTSEILSTAALTALPLARFYRASPVESELMGVYTPINPSFEENILKPKVSKSFNRQSQLVHLTNKKAAVAINKEGKLASGKYEIYGLDKSKMPKTYFGKKVATFGVRDVSSQIDIPEELNQYFVEPPVIGPIGLLRRHFGVRTAPLGTFDLINKEFYPNMLRKPNGEYRMATSKEINAAKRHRWTMDYGMDTGLHGIGGATLLNRWYLNKKDNN